MKLAFSLRYLSQYMGIEKASAALSDAGIKLLNFTPHSSEELSDALKIFEKYGMSVYQTHGPDNRYSDVTEEQLARNMAHCLELSAKIGAKYVAVHGNVFDYAHITYTPEAALKHNYEFFAPAVELAERLDIKLAFENTFADTPELKFGKPHFCAKVEDQAALIDSFGSDHACACWDTGHGAIANKEAQPEAIKLLGKRIECTHIHDNELVHDKHLTPFEGIIDWKSCMGALKAFTNTEVLCYEHVYGEISEAEVGEFARKLYEIGMKLSDM